MPDDLLSRPLIEIAGDLRAKRVTAGELVEVNCHMSPSYSRERSGS
jgi:hypothetical protein